MTATSTPLKAYSRVIFLVAVYRLGIAVTLMFIGFFQPLNLSPGAELLAQFIAVTYLVYALFVLMFLERASIPAVRYSFYLDLLFIFATMHSFGGVNTSLGILLVVFILGASALVKVREAVTMAAVSSLFILGEQLYRYLIQESDLADFGRTGVLGAVYFVAAVTISSMARQVRVNRSLAEQRSIDLKNMSELNDYIIQRMGSGVIVVDEKNDITLTNDAAWYMMGMQSRAAISHLEAVSPEIFRNLLQWRSGEDMDGHTLSITGSPDIVPRFIGLGERRNHGVLILLEDSSLLNQQAQHLKLTAMGRLTASIAHEIRNPLGAISHAAQLLVESEDLETPDRRLVDIIQQNSARTNNVIENIMQLTRKDKASPESIELDAWLSEFVTEFVGNNKLENDQIRFEAGAEKLTIQFDVGHLHQIMSNLCQNALVHGLEQSKRKLIEVRIGHDTDSHGPVLDVIDYGPGIEPEKARQIFEPFFTTATKGTGLGLYIAKELASVNQAKLDYVPVRAGGSCFRLTFKDNN